MSKENSRVFPPCNVERMRHAGTGMWSGATERETAWHALQRRIKWVRQHANT